MNITNMQLTSSNECNEWFHVRKECRGKMAVAMRRALHIPFNKMAPMRSVTSRPMLTLTTMMLHDERVRLSSDADYMVLIPHNMLNHLNFLSDVQHNTQSMQTFQYI